MGLPSAISKGTQTLSGSEETTVNPVGGLPSRGVKSQTVFPLLSHWSQGKTTVDASETPRPGVRGRPSTPEDTSDRPRYRCRILVLRGTSSAKGGI